MSLAHSTTFCPKKTGCSTSKSNSRPLQEKKLGITFRKRSLIIQSHYVPAFFCITFRLFVYFFVFLCFSAHVTDLQEKGKKQTYHHKGSTYLQWLLTINFAQTLTRRKTATVPTLTPTIIMATVSTESDRCHLLEEKNVIFFDSSQIGLLIWEEHEEVMSCALTFMLVLLWR